jgi:NAD(P)H-nitrite reductase large subunit
MNRRELVIAGGGLAAARAIKSYREAGGEGRITLVGEEPTLPYHRPALSKKYLRGETTETPLVEGERFYRDHDVDVLLEKRVVRVDPAARTVTLGGRPVQGIKLAVSVYCSIPFLVCCALLFFYEIDKPMEARIERELGERRLRLQPVPASNQAIPTEVLIHE